MNYKYILFLFISSLLVISLIFSYKYISDDFNNYNLSKNKISCLYEADNLIVSSAEIIKEFEQNSITYDFTTYNLFVQNMQNFDNYFNAYIGKCNNYLLGINELKSEYTKFSKLTGDYKSYFESLSKLQIKIRKDIKIEIENINLKI